MIDVYVDASLSRTKWGCAGVVITPVAPLSFPTLEFTYPLKAGTPSSQGEMLAIVHGAQATEQALKLIDYMPIHTIVRLRTDSAACVRALSRPSRLRSKAFIALTKTARQSWDRLREQGIINGWDYKQVPRDENPADQVSRRGRETYLELYRWEQNPKPARTSGPSSSREPGQKGQPRS